METELESPSWVCPRCGEVIPEVWAKCWSCGTTSDGVEDPNFKTADERPVRETADKPRPIRLATILAVLTFCGGILAIAPLVSTGLLRLVFTLVLAGVVGGFLIRIIVDSFPK